MDTAAFEEHRPGAHWKIVRNDDENSDTPNSHSKSATLVTSKDMFKWYEKHTELTAGRPFQCRREMLQ